MQYAAIIQGQRTNDTEPGFINLSDSEFCKCQSQRFEMIQNVCSFFFYFLNLHMVKFTFLGIEFKMFFQSSLGGRVHGISFKRGQNYMRLSILKAVLPSILSLAANEPRDKLHQQYKVMTTQGEIFVLHSHQLSHSFLFSIFPSIPSFL